MSHSDLQMGLFPQRFIDDLRLQANIVQIVQEFVPLKRAGATYKGLCPFHSEKTPSFHVNPEKGFFHCFGCGVGGDVFKFLEMHEKVGFQDAVRQVAQKLAVPLPEMNERGSDDDARREAALRETLLKLHEEAAIYFREQLTAAGGTRARAQLRERGISSRTIEDLRLGYAPSSTRESLKGRLLHQGFPEGLLIQSGLVIQRDNGELVDRFRNRLIIPICREAGSVIAFAGRSMDPEQVPKYLNSPETPIYTKGRTLYGLNVSKAAIRNLGYVVLVEGYFDFAQLFQANVAPVVASCGTALTVPQAQLLRRFTSKVALNFDPDTAGQGAAARSSELLVSEGFDVTVVVLDQGEDPDTFLRKHGPEGYRDKLRNSRPYLEYLLDRAAAGLDFTNDDNRRQFLNRMLAVAARIPDAAARDQFGDRLAHKARVAEEVVRTEIRKAAVNRQAVLTNRQLPSFGQVRSAEKGLIWAVVHNTSESLDALATLDEEDLSGLASREVFEMVRTLQGEPSEFVPSALLQRLSTLSAQLVTSIAASSAPPAPPFACARALKRLRWEREGAAIQREIDRLQGLGANSHGSEIDALWQRKKDLLRRIEELV